MRIQFYPSANLEKRLEADALDQGITTSAMVNDILNRHYGLIPPSSMSDIEVGKKVWEELRRYVRNAPQGKEFDLNEASPTYRKIEMVYAGRPRILKAKLGKEFAAKIGEEEFRNVEQVRAANGLIKRTVCNRAALYRIKVTDDKAGE